MMTFERFMESMYDAEKEAIMKHSSEDVEKARSYIDYLTKDELQEVQTTGRYWCFDSYNNLYIAIDNEVALCLLRDVNGNIVSKIFPRNPLDFSEEFFTRKHK